MSITSANSVATITVPGLFPTPVQLENFTADSAWDTDAVDLAEVVMSIDGRKTSGYTPNPVRQNWHFMADSASVDIFDNIYRATKAKRDTYDIYATIDLPSVGKSYSCLKGTLTSWKPLPDGGKVLGGVDFAIVWESINPTIT